MKRLILGITGASGAVLAKRFIECAKEYRELHIIITDNGLRVFEFETGISFKDFIESQNGIIVHDNRDMFACVASGSFDTEGMVIIPCSMASAAKLANGIGDTLLLHAADICLKEKRRLVIVPRETPLHAIHLKNLQTLAETGAYIVPPMPMFYSKPASADDIINSLVGRILKYAGVDNTLYMKWGGQK
ncbi:MAG: UbiX family flavin prenyltransferase [Bacillota bacterium]|nr:UbiX family flavin prenyltransferase [Bacillota bacterium]